MNNMDSTEAIFDFCFWGTKHRIVSRRRLQLPVQFQSSSYAEASLILARCWMRCSNDQIWSSKWPRSFSTEPMKPEVPSALPGDLNEGGMRQDDAIVLQKSEGFYQTSCSKSLHNQSSSEIQIPRAYHIPWKCDHASCIIMLLLLVQAMSKQLQTFLRWKIRTAIGFPTTSGLGKSYLQDTASSKNLFTTYKSVNVAVFAVQFWTNWFTNSSFCRDTTWGCFKIRDTQKVNRSSEPLDLGAGKSWETPGKLYFTTIPSYWDQFWVVSPGWYESTLSTTPKTPRKVIPVKDSSGEKLGIGSSWANSEVKNPGHQKRLHGPSCSRAWTFTSVFFRLDLTPSFNISFRDMLDGSLENCLNCTCGHWCEMSCNEYSNCKRHSPRRLYHPTANENINCYDDSCDLFASSTWFLLCRSQDTFICIQNSNMKQWVAWLRESEPGDCSAPCWTWTWTWPPCNPRHGRVGHGRRDENWRIFLVGFVDRECYWCFFLQVFFLWCGNCDMIIGDVWVGVVVGWWGSFFPLKVLAMLWW